MRVAAEFGVGQFQAVDDAGVVELVRQDQVAAPGQCGQHADVGVVAAVEHQRRTAVVKLTQSPLQPVAGGRVAGQQSAGSARLRQFGRRKVGGVLFVKFPAQLRVAGNTHIVVAGKIAVASAVIDRPPVRFRRDFAQHPEPSGRFQRRGVGGEFFQPGHIASPSFDEIHFLTIAPQSSKIE